MEKGGRNLKFFKNTTLKKFKFLPPFFYLFRTQYNKYIMNCMNIK